MTEKEVYESLNYLLQDAIRVYNENGKNAYDGGVCEGIKRAMEEIEAMPA